MRTKRLILIALFAGAALMLRAQDRSEPDSLVTAFEVMPHDSTRLRLLYETSSKLRFAEPERGGKLNDMLIGQALEEQNTYYLSKGYLTRIVIAYNVYDSETVTRTMELLEPVARKGKHYDDLFRGWRCVIDHKLLTQDYESGEAEARKLLREAEELDNKMGISEGYQCLAYIYRATFRRQQAIELLDKALPLVQALGNEGAILNTLQAMIFIYQEMGANTDYKKWHRALELFEQYLLKGLDPESPDPGLLILYGNYIDYYRRLGEFDKAGQLVEKVEKLYYPYIQTLMCRFYYNDMCVNYFVQAGQYPRALGKIDDAIDDLGKVNTGNDYHNLLARKAWLLDRMGNWTEALPLYKQTISFKDSLQVEAINKQYEELRKTFNTDQLELERARIRHRTQLIMLSLLGLGLFVIAYFIAYLLRSRKALRAAEQEMRGMARQMEQVNEAKDRFLSNISSTIRTPLNWVVDGSMKLAAHEVEDPAEQQQLSATIRTMSSDLLNVINDILDLSRLEAGMMKFDVTDVEATSQIFDAAASSAVAVDIRIGYPEDTLYTVRFDAMRLRQVFGSLFVPLHAGEGIVAEIRKDGELLTLCVSGSALAQENPPQEIIIRNEINRMLILRFDGSYDIGETDGQRTVTISLPAQPMVF